MNPTEQYIQVLTKLKHGEIGLLRMHAGQGLDVSVAGYDLFAGLWWPLRQKNECAPRREVAWLIAKLYAACPTSPSPGNTLARQLGRCQPGEKRARDRFRQKFDALLMLPIDNIEPALRWALDWTSSCNMKIDWVKLTDDLSIWERETTRLKWAEHFMETDERDLSC